MTAVLVTDAPANTPEWHAARANGIGASEIAAVVGLSPFESAFSLWHRKAGNLPGPDPANPLFYWGHALEPLVAQKFIEEHPEYGKRTIGIHRSAERPWQLASLDRVLVRHEEPETLAAILEIKTTRYGDNWGPSGSTQIPLHVACQIQQQMDVFSAPCAWVAVLIGGNDYREYRIPFDEDDASALRLAGAAFWDSLLYEEEPPIDASWETYEAVRELHPDISGDDVEIDPDLWAAFHISKADADQANDTHRQIKSRVLDAMGEARRALLEGRPVLRRQPGRNGSVSLYPIAQKEAS